MSKAKKIITSPRIIILIIALIFSVVAINPHFDNEGVMIKSVLKGGPSELAGMTSPKASTPPLSKEVITSINNINIRNVDDYYNAVFNLVSGQAVAIQTNQGIYNLQLGNISSNPLGLSVADAPTTNLRKGLDLQGGTRVLLGPEEQISNEEMSLLVDNLKERLNVYGLSDIVVRQVSDSLFGEGNQYILVEIAGANEDEVKELISTQGKFEAKIGNKTVFLGGQDIKNVCRDASCSGLDPQRCGPVTGGYSCGFQFSVTLSTDAAARQASITKDLSVIVDNGYEKLNESLIFYLDDEQVNELSIAAGLKGEAVTQVSISGGGSGADREEAIDNALKEMKQMQTVLITGSLPVKLEILKTDTLSPILGEEFLKNVMEIGIFAILAVSLVIFARYRKVEISIPVIVTMVSEIIMILGFASMVGWNLDLAAIAGILIAVGTGVDHLIVISDETLKSESSAYLNWKQKVKRAFVIILVAFFTTTAALIPLLVAGAGLLKGFALTTIMGLLIGVFIARPAFASAVEILLAK